MQPRQFQSTSSGIDHNVLPARLWHKAKRLGVWDPKDIDFTQDKSDWQAFTELEQRLLLHLTSLFLGGEESVADDLLPLLLAINKTGRLEESLYLTSFLFEEAKHVEVFRRFLDEVSETTEDLSHFHGPFYQQLFGIELPTAMNKLLTDHSPVAIASASVTYNMIVEGVLAETGYHAYQQIITERGVMPGMQEVTQKLNMDESRHIAFGVYLLSRLVAEHGDPVWEVIEERMNHLLMIALGMIQETFDQYDEIPFGFTVELFTDYAMSQFQKRYARIEKARSQTLEQIMAT